VLGHALNLPGDGLASRFSSSLRFSTGTSSVFKKGEPWVEPMVIELHPDEYGRIWPLVQELAEYNLYVKTVCEGVTPGKVLVDDALNPRSAFMDTPEGSFLVGYPGNAEFNSAMRDELPYLIDLSYHPDSWEPKLRDIVKNKVALSHTYRYYTFEEGVIGDWRNGIPPGYELRRVDAETLGSGLDNLIEVSSSIDKNWRSTEEFLERGFCFIIVHGDAIVSRCGTDCVSGDRCEIGIWTAPSHRGKGLASLAAMGTVEHCLSRGLTRIGWHCIDTNIGSIKVAEKVGFRRTRDYTSFGTELPAANASDLDRATWRRLAEEYGTSPDLDNMFRYRAAECWALAGEPIRSMDLLNGLVDDGWLKPSLAYLLKSWPFEGMRGEAGWSDLVRRLVS
jgi:RimJ/RimL family protein N-acetyltransferase